MINKIGVTVISIAFWAFWILLSVFMLGALIKGVLWILGNIF
ncbi:hypothetical protein [Listeria monocytogenes]|nr:hypothetical protein [Listeria monocytogenes]NP_463529.1 gp64 [Listeria phage A118]YP_001468897.1 gp57 [Listeria phage A006]AAY53294.1 gp57 [Listeria phage A006]AKI56200.1 hypothetical protein L2074_02681 [Listeria monocytogenes]MDN7330635.1 hypothetical protein [Listeria monocytogenes]RJZ72568.1 hypothetical protein DYZ70_02924 [Listeria monocytogenes]RKA98735.1 hypothetical protein AFX56_01587 [Listeria monocytogenes]